MTSDIETIFDVSREWTTIRQIDKRGSDGQPDLRVALRAAIVAATGDDATRKNFDDIRRTRACYRCGASPEHCECPDAYEQ